MAHKMQSGWWKTLIWSLLGAASVGILFYWLYQDNWKAQENYQTYIVLLVILAFLIFLPIFYIFGLPQILNKLAEEDRFITKREENTWIPIENSGQFKTGILVCHGKVLYDNFRDAEIIDTKDLEKTPDWLNKKGFEWLGVHSPGITKTGSLDIIVTRVKQSLSQGVPVEKCVSEELKTIRNLRIEFPLFVLVKEIELSDGVLATFLVRAQIKVIRPGKFWYGQNGKSFESLIVAIRDKVNLAVEKNSMVDFLLEDGHEKIKKMLQDTPLDLSDALGVKTLRIDIDSWVHDASKDYLAQINAKTRVDAELKESEAVLKKREKIAVGEVSVLKAEQKREAARVDMEKTKARAIKAQGGGDPLIAQAALEVAVVGVGGRNERLKYQALEKTNVTVLGDMGLGGFYGANNPRPQPDKKPDEDKKKGGGQ